MKVNIGPAAQLVEVPAFDCWHLLRSAEIARVAWNGPHGVAVVPVNYAIADGALWFRTSPYAAVARDGGEQWIAAEVDNLDARSGTGWSVVVRGVAELVDAMQVPEHLVDLRVWPAGPRSLFVRIAPVEITGRKLLPVPVTDQVSP